jgi:hypothetical protein
MDDKHHDLNDHKQFQSSLSVKSDTNATTSSIESRTKNNNTIVFRNDQNCSIVEILSPKNNNKDNDDVRFVNAVCIQVEPKACSRVVKGLSLSLPLEDGLSHLKRVRRCTAPIIATNIIPVVSNTVTSDTSHDKNTNSLARPNKRLRSSFVLELLIGTQNSRLIPSSGDDSAQSLPSLSSSSTATKEVPFDNHPIVREFGPLYSVMVPKYEPRSEQEWKEHNSMWPTHYYPLKFDEYQRKQIALSESDQDQIIEFMDRSISTQSVIIVNPKYNPKDPENKIGSKEDDGDNHPDIVSTSQKERKQQQHNQSSSSLLDNNPLATPILLAIQDVSRREREASVSIEDPSSTSIDGTNVSGIVPGSVTNEEGQQPDRRRRQYICTGYDVYCFYEPNIFGKFILIGEQKTVY